MDSLGYPIMPNFGAEATDNTLGSTSAANAYTTDTNTQSHNTNDAINNIEFSARGTSDISVILDQLMTITDQVNHRITFTLNYWKFDDTMSYTTLCTFFTLSVLGWSQEAFTQLPQNEAGPFLGSLRSEEEYGTGIPQSAWPMRPTWPKSHAIR